MSQVVLAWLFRTKSTIHSELIGKEKETAILLDLAVSTTRSAVHTLPLCFWCYGSKYSIFCAVQSVLWCDIFMRVTCGNHKCISGTTKWQEGPRNWALMRNRVNESEKITAPISSRWQMSDGHGIANGNAASAENVHPYDNTFSQNCFRVPLLYQEGTGSNVVLSPDFRRILIYKSSRENHIMYQGIHCTQWQQVAIAACNSWGCN